MITYTTRPSDTDVAVAEESMMTAWQAMTEATAAYEHTQTHPWAYAPDGDDAFQRFCAREQAVLNHRRARELYDSMVDSATDL